MMRLTPYRPHVSSMTASEGDPEVYMTSTLSPTAWRGGDDEVVSVNAMSRPSSVLKRTRAA